jgi:hypothetical protein
VKLRLMGILYIHYDAYAATLSSDHQSAVKLDEPLPPLCRKEEHCPSGAGMGHDRTGPKQPWAGWGG